MGSFSPDALLLAASIAFGASCFVPGSGWPRWVQGASLALVASKPFYAPVALLALATPGGKLAWRLGVVALGLVPGALWMLLVAGLMGPVRTDIDFDGSRQLAGVLRDPISYLRLAAENIVLRGRGYAVSMVGVLGWLDRPIPTPHLLLAYGLALVSPVFCGKERQPASTWWVLILVCVLSTAAIQLANYLMFSIVGTQAIHGVQGRYFLPLFVLVLLAACGWVSVRRTWVSVAFVGAIAANALLTIYFVVDGYYD